LEEVNSEFFFNNYLDRNNCTGVTTTQDPLTKLTKVTALENERVVGVACGDVHSLFLTAQNELYTCGGNDYYQLGNNGSEHHMQEINIQKHIGDGRITHISSGYYFSCCVVSMFQFLNLTLKIRKICGCGVQITTIS
jgi:hypothetical protein